MKLTRKTAETWCAKLAIGVTLAGIGFLSGFIAIIWGIV